MDVNESSMKQQEQLRSSYLNSITKQFNKAEARNRLHEQTLKLAEKNYRGEMLQNLSREENSQFSEDMQKICLEIDALAEGEAGRLEGLKREEVANTSDKEIGAITRIDRIADLMTRDEMQLMADEYRNFPLVQRKLSKISNQRGIPVNTYPGIDQKLEAVNQVAADMKGFISSRDFGLAPGIYMKISFPEYDDILDPTIKKEAEDDNT